MRNLLGMQRRAADKSLANSCRIGSREQGVGSRELAEGSREQGVRRRELA